MTQTFYKTIISGQTLSNHLEDPDWVVIDCRFDLTNTDWGRQSFLEKHIPGAVYAHLDHDLSSPITPTTGRHPLPNPHVFAQKLGQWGISDRSQVIVYDTSGGAYASRLWWMLRFLGHENVAVLDGGFVQWENLGDPGTSVVTPRSPTQFQPQINPAMIANIEEVEIIREDPSYRLVDARTAERYRGEKEPIDLVAGHIPGAINRFHGENLNSQGLFKTSNELQLEYLKLIGDTPPQNVIVYCGSGVTSCHHILAMEIAGLQGAKLYPGSWSEWIRDPNRLIAKGNPS